MERCLEDTAVAAGPAHPSPTTSPRDYSRHRGGESKRVIGTIRGVGGKMKSRTGAVQHPRQAGRQQTSNTLSAA